MFTLTKHTHTYTNTHTASVNKPIVIRVCVCLGVLHPGSLSVSQGEPAGKIQEGDQEITQQWHLQRCLSPARRKIL